MLTATEWQAKEIARLTEGFGESGKAKRIFEPPRTLFVSDDEHRLALTMRVKLCDKAGHKGERVMVCSHTNFYYEKGAPVHCKSCKMGKSRQVTATKRQDRIVVYATAEEWFANVAHATTRDGQTIGSCRLPIKDEFSSDEEYDKAKRMRQERYKEFQRQFHAREEVREKDNAYHREEYANMSNEAKRQKMDRDQTNKNARKAVALNAGMCWCPFGSHAANPTEMIFCPKADLDMEDFRGTLGSVRRDVCRHHYKEWRRSHRSFRTKYRADLSLRVRFRLAWFRHGATRKGKTILLTQSEQEKMVTSPCAYCHKSATAETPSEIDMLDAMCTEYRADTCVPACHQCNMAKGGMLPRDYVSKCAEVAAFKDEGIRATQYTAYRQIYGTKKNARVPKLYYGSSNYDKFKYAARQRNLVFEITESRFDALKKQGCAYCGLMRPVFIGMDRIDSSKGYTVDNVCGCCTTCNMMKRDADSAEFVRKCAEVATSQGTPLRHRSRLSSADPLVCNASPFVPIDVPIDDRMYERSAVQRLV